MDYSLKSEYDIDRAEIWPNSAILKMILRFNISHLNPFIRMCLADHPPLEKDATCDERLKVSGRAVYMALAINPPGWWSFPGSVHWVFRIHLAYSFRQIEQQLYDYI